MKHKFLPRKSQPVPAAFTPEVVARLMAVAQANNETLSETIVNLVIRGLESLEASEPS